MVLKSLFQLSQDAVVGLTLICMENSPDHQILWKCITQAWKTMSSLPLRTSYLYYQQFHSFSHAYAHKKVMYTARNDTALFITLLASGCPFIMMDVFKQRRKLVLSKKFLEKSASELEHYYNRLMQLDLTGIDLMGDDSFLTSLLVKCPKLSNLNLGINATPDTLIAAKSCPLTKLQVDEKDPKDIVLKEKVLSLVLIGVPSISFKELISQQSVKRAQRNNDSSVKSSGTGLYIKYAPHQSPFWPNLRELDFSNCRISAELISKCMIVLPKLEKVSSHKANVSKAVLLLQRVNFDYHTQMTFPLKTLILSFDFDWWDNHINNWMFPLLEHLTILAFGYTYPLLDAAMGFADSLKSLCSLKISTLRYAAPETLKLHSFQHLPVNIKVLELCGNNISLCEIYYILKYFINLKDIKLSYSYLLDSQVPEDHNVYHQTLSRIALECNSISDEILVSLLRNLPNLSHITLGSRSRPITLTDGSISIIAKYAVNIETFKLFPKQPTVKNSDATRCNGFEKNGEASSEFRLNVKELLPVASRDQSRNLELHLPYSSSTTKSIEALQSAGWVVFPVCTHC